MGGLHALPGLTGRLPSSAGAALPERSAHEPKTARERSCPMNIRLLLCGLATVMGAAVLLSVGSTATRAADKVQVVASFSILDDMVRQVGGDRVEVRTLVG